MFAEQKDMILKAIDLADARLVAREKYEAEHGAKKWGVYLPEEKALADYLMGLDRESVETLEAIMLLGRDDEYHHPDRAPEENYLKLKEERYHRHPDQEIAVYYLTGKKPLKDFLDNGLNYLGIIL